MSVVKFAPFNSLLSLFMIKRRVVVVWYLLDGWLDGWSKYSIQYYLIRLVYKVADSTVDMSVVTLRLDTGPAYRRLTGIELHLVTLRTLRTLLVCLPAQHFGNRRKVTQFDVPGIYLTQHLLHITYNTTLSDLMLFS